MLILLPPSETKHPGGTGPAWDEGVTANWRFPELTTARREAAAALVALSAEPDTAARVLGLSERQRDQIAVNAHLHSAPTMSAVERYTGVLYDALDVRSLDRYSRRWLSAHAAVQTAAFGLVGADDGIPAYRLAAGASVPGLGSLKRHWSAVTSAAIAAAGPAFVLDLRSEAYVALGPVPPAVSSGYVRVVAEDEHGTARALNHFNKHAKGQLVRRLAIERPTAKTLGGFLRWAERTGIHLRTRDGELQLVADN